MFRYLRSFSIYIFNLYFSLSFLKYNFELHSFEFWIPKFISILNFFWISRKRIESFWIWKWHLIGLRLVRSISSLIEEFDEWNFMECNPIIVEHAIKSRFTTLTRRHPRILGESISTRCPEYELSTWHTRRERAAFFSSWKRGNLLLFVETKDFLPFVFTANDFERKTKWNTIFTAA